ncbi:MAG: tryptophan 7-halogenase, partial [Henriciella sp.]|uniref:tryptophan 7-halogenase n=1 Tax=Henriciella sp. TaxID=1968823 RepID=UPI003C78C695
VTEDLANLFSRKMNRELEQVRDFLILHYKLTEREDSDFWRSRKAMEIPDTLAERIALFRDSAHAYNNCDELFLTDSWVQVMMGQGLHPAGRHAVGHMFPDDKLKGALDAQRAQLDKVLSQLPAHEDFLKQYCPAEPA